MNIGSLITRHALYRSEHDAFVIGEQRLNFRELNSRVNLAANALLSAGLRKGEKMATVLPNCEELMLLYWAAAKTGIVIVPSSPLLQAHGLATLLNDSDTEIVFADVSFKSMIKKMQENLPEIKKERWILVGGNEENYGFTRWTDFISDLSDEEPPDANLVDDDVYNIMYSSGTTGAQKA